MPLEGIQLSYKHALALCSVVGFKGRELTTVVALMCAESGRYTEAWHENENGSVDRGLFQLNTIHAEVSDAEAYNPKYNAMYAYALSQRGQDFSPWAAYNSGAHRKFIPVVWAVRVTGLWRTRKGYWERYDARA